jgi:hypothetical protein
MKHLKLALILCCFAPASLVGQDVNKEKNKLTTLYSGSTAYSGNMHFLGITDKEKLLVYNPATFTLSKTFVPNRKGNITAFTFLPDTKSIIAFASDKSITQWDIASGTLLNEIKTEESPAYGVMAGFDHVAFITEKKMFVYRLSSKSKLFETNAYAKAIRSLAAFPDGTKLITGSGDGKLIIYNAVTGEKSGEIINHKTFIRAIDVSIGNNLMIASGDDDGNVVVQDEIGKVKFRFDDAKGWVHSVKFSWDGGHLAVGDDWGNIYIYSIERGLLVEKLSGTNSPIISLAFSPDGKELAFYEKQKSVRVWSVPKLNLPSVFKLKDQKDRTPPQIYVSNPPNIQDDKVRIYKDLVEIKGTLMDESGIRGLKVNGIEVPIKENNNFVIIQPLSMGDNSVVIEAKDVNDNISIKRFTVQRKNMEGETYDVTKARNFLFVVGINDYEHWPKLNNAVKDANDITSTLLKQYSFDFGNVTLLKNEQATRSNIYKSLRSLIEQVTPQDNLLIYFSGHGYFDGVLNEGYWIPVDAKVNNSGDYLSNSDILKLIGNIDSQHTFLIADACFSGSLFSDSKRGYAENVEKFKSRWGLASGRLEVVSDGEIGKNSPFATATITFLNDNTKDKLAISELIQYVKMKVAETSDQTPLGNPLKATGDEGGEMVLYKKKN